MPITEGGTTAPVDSATTKVWGLYDGTNLYLPRRANGRGWWTGAYTIPLRANFTRPANTTAYTSGDAITNSTSAPTIITFSGAHLDNGGSGLILSAILTSSVNAATDLVSDLVILDTTATPTNDNDPFAITDTEIRTIAGVIHFTTPTDMGANNTLWEANGLNIAYRCDAASTSLFGLLVARNGYTPTSSERFDLQLTVQLN